MKRLSQFLLVGASALLLCAQSHSHGRFIVPSHTMLSAEAQAHLTVQASISNEVFHPDMPFANNDKGIKVNPKLTKVFSMLSPFALGPDQQKHAMSYQAFNRYSVSDLSLTQKGTYGLHIEQTPFVVTTFKQANGEPGREFGPGKNLPEGVTQVQRRLFNIRSSSYVSFNGTSDVQVQGKGLELAGHHPNDIFTGEAISLQLLLDGKPAAAGTEIAIIKAGTRHRNQRNIIELSTNEQGKFEITFAEAGFYLLETQVSKDSKQKGIDVEQATLYVTLEVFPE